MVNYRFSGQTDRQTDKYGKKAFLVTFFNFLETSIIAATYAKLMLLLKRTFENYSVFWLRPNSDIVVAVVVYLCRASLFAGF